MTTPIPDMDPGLISLDDQIAAVRREIGKRRGVYQRLVDAGKMAEASASREIAAMRAVLISLEGLGAPGLFK